MDVSDISRMLAQQVSSLIPDLLPGAVREGHEWRVGSIAGERGRSLSIHADGPRAGVWADFSDSNLKGDILDLIAAVRFGGDKARALAFAKSYLGIDQMDPARLKIVQAQAKKKAQGIDDAAVRESEAKRKVARAIWLSGAADLTQTPVDFYLRGRGIDLSSLLRMPGALRYHAGLDYPAGMNDGRRESYPAMVAAVVNGDGIHVATHRTYLKDYGGGLVKKAPVRDAKLCLGAYRGGHIPLSRGASSRALKEAKDGESVILCEGIEDGLTLAMLLPTHRVLAAISVSNFQNVWLPPTIREVIIAADRDPPGSKAAETLQRAVDAFIDQGREVRVAYSPAGKDFNDALIAAAEKGRESMG